MQSDGVVFTPNWDKVAGATRVDARRRKQSQSGVKVEIKGVPGEGGGEI